jgi:hypothetical protein
MTPGQIALEPERLTFLSVSPSIFLDRIRNMRYQFLLTESLPAQRLPGPGGKKPRLFENLPDHNPRASSGEEENSLFLSLVTH